MYERFTRKRRKKGEFHGLVTEVKLADEELFFKMFVMTSTKLETLLSLVFINLSKPNARHEPIGPGEQMSVKLQYICNITFSTITHSYRMSDASVGKIFRETCTVLWKRLSERGFIKQPYRTAEWRNTALEYEKYSNFLNCAGAIDRKYVTIHCLARRGSMYFNYKKFHSIVLLDVLNA